MELSGLASPSPNSKYQNTVCLYFLKTTLQTLFLLKLLVYTKTVIQAAIPPDRVPVSPQSPVPLPTAWISPSPPIPAPLAGPHCRRCDGECRHSRPRPWRQQARPQLLPPAATLLSYRRPPRSPSLALLCPQLRRILGARSVLARPALPCFGGCCLWRGYQESPAASSPGPGQGHRDDSQTG